MVRQAAAISAVASLLGPILDPSRRPDPRHRRGIVRHRHRRPQLLARKGGDAESADLLATRAMSVSADHTAAGSEQLIEADAGPTATIAYATEHGANRPAL